jgi:hypothetical protein
MAMSTMAILERDLRSAGAILVRAIKASLKRLRVPTKRGNYSMTDEITTGGSGGYVHD